jgi:Ni,Fe-hydrogenase I cytochrome b subunit
MEAAVDQLVSMNLHEVSYECLEVIKKYFINAAKPDEKYRKIKKSNDVYQVLIVIYVVFQFLLLLGGVRLFGCQQETDPPVYRKRYTQLQIHRKF